MRKPEISFRRADSPADWTCAACGKVVPVGRPLANPHLADGGIEICEPCARGIVRAIAAARSQRYYRRLREIAGYA